jgi:hypothetical protein
MECPAYAGARQGLFQIVETYDYSKMIATPRKTAIWLQRTNLLPQFSLGLEN